MDELDWLSAQFQTNRSNLRAVTYRMLGSLTEADDAVQESWPRVSRSGTSGVQNLAGWLTTVVARVCLDMLRSRTSRREELFGASLCQVDLFVGLVVSASAGSGSDLSEESVVGVEPAALDFVVAPECPPGPASVSVCASRTRRR